MNKYIYHAVLVTGDSFRSHIVQVDNDHEFSTWDEADKFAVQKNKNRGRLAKGIWVAYYAKK